MTLNFALTLTHEGVALLQRAPRGWLLVGEVALDDPALEASLAALRATALSMAPEGMATKLVIPQSEILYTEIPSPGPDPLLREGAIRTALDGATPYAVNDLVFDWSASGDRLRVAVVARQTLEEAEAFADRHGFAPVSFVARPEAGQFLGEPFFGATARMGPGAEVDRDVIPVEVAGRAEKPSAAVKAIFARPASVSSGGGARTDAAAAAAKPAAAEVTAAPAGASAAPASTPAEAPDPRPAEPGPDAASPRPSAPAPAPAAKAPPAPPTEDKKPAGAPAPAPASPAKAPPGTGGEADPRQEEKPGKASAPKPDAPVPAAAKAQKDPGPGPVPKAQLPKAGAVAPPQRVPPKAPQAAPAVSLGSAVAASAEPPARTAEAGPLGGLAGAMRDGVSAAGRSLRGLVPGESAADGAALSPGAAAGAAPVATAALRTRPAPEPRSETPPLAAPGPDGQLVAGARATLASLRERSSQPLAVDGTATEAEAMTVFGARRRSEPQPGPRAGLLVTAALALVLAGVGVWAGFFLVTPDRTAGDPPAGDSAATGQGAPMPADTMAEADDAAGDGPAAFEPFDVDQPVAAAPPVEPETAAPETAEADAAPPVSADPAQDAEVAQTAAVSAPPEADLLSGATEALPAPQPLASDDVAVPSAEVAAPVAVAQTPEPPAEARPPRIGAPPPALDAAVQAVADGAASTQDGATPASLPPEEAGLTIEVTDGPPPVVPDLRRALRSRHLLLEGGIAVPEDAEPLARPPGLGGDGALRLPPPMPLSGPPAAGGTDTDTAAADPAAVDEEDGEAATTAVAANPRGTAGPGSLWSAPATATQPPPARSAAPEAEGPAPQALDGTALAEARSTAVGASLAAGPVAAAPAGAVAPGTIATFGGPSPSPRPATLAVPSGPTRLVIRDPGEDALRPSLRPGSIVEMAAAAEARLASATPRAVAASPLPGTRPADFSAVVARAQPTRAPAAAAAQPAAVQAPPPAAVASAPAATAPSLPTRASVAQQATESRAINLRSVNLIGVFGTSSQRRALVRLPDGRIAAVRVGDRLDGGQVAAIGDSELRYVRGGRNTVLRIGG